MRRLICLLLCLSLALCGCVEPEFHSPGIFHYPRAETAYQGTTGVLAPEVRELSGIEHDLCALLKLYCAGPLDPSLLNPLPAGTELLEHTLYDHVLTLRFNRAFARLSGVELTVAASCLAQTFLPLTGASELILTADGALLSGSTSLRLTLEELSLRDESLDLLHAEFPVYYTSTERRYLFQHTISVPHTAPEELAMYLLEQLLTPPAGSGQRSALPEGARFLSVTLDNGLCTVDVSQEFESKRFYAMSAQCLSLLSVVNTLTALPEINRVEFTVEGNLLIRYGELDIASPLVRDERCIGPVRTSLGEVDAILYLVHGHDGKLVPVPARLQPDTSASMPERMVRALLHDPGTNGVQSCISPGTRLLSARIQQGICILDLSREYLDQPELLPYSNRVLTATICALKDVKGVRILVEGTVPQGFETIFSGIFAPVDDWFL